jgi:hypothetical protein
LGQWHRGATSQTQVAVARRRKVRVRVAHLPRCNSRVAPSPHPLSAETCLLSVV